MGSVRVAMVLVAMVGAIPAAAQTPPGSGAPGVITDGSANISIGGQAAARSGDRTTDPGATVQGSSPNVFINGRPAATVGDKTECGGVVIGGAPNVFINGKPVARSGDLTTGCPGK
jgi:uncharacterized Zn-binding protein involved in type VI secretion